MMFHPFHLVEKSPWPLTSSISAFSLTLGFVSYFQNLNNNLILMSFIMIFFSSFQWWRDISREASFQGFHTSWVLSGLKMGMLLFILSEIFFFISFFWAFFHSSLSPNIEIGSQWPPKNIFPFNPFEIPLLNSAILISSGITVTWSHHSILNKNYISALNSLKVTILLGFMFTIFQIFEYFQAQFSISDSIFGSTFFMTTGFHGFHVLVGSIFLMVSYFRIYNQLISSNHFFGFEASAWYWHFVDVVWLFLFTFMYWWVY
uniref:cytochrome c oxidase subunit III n=1 Tax=Dermacentor reticulatus TaxID=57047 RepID=UPI00226D1A27|nr:cytochrome c oxidase subunit III [Dermacentor reticulatus]UZG91447.1 cytochrome c oxidase subunit 3 [Dermacentor reticulatus]UZG91460.1 cytochrome c oxidase subunit 3 [Dermacentor reticulatus]UZG91473.1 cytochrome c oxidase subunit 3 [Dermacentor reticulatus]UZG91486.1 cytochrome c oxidase subunit 3 [Dermacentor reticulatus]UZG91499.1 cytochrome c oxidase subunit 3 [Dermacentor reticulatus]